MVLTLLQVTLDLRGAIMASGSLSEPALKALSDANERTNELLAKAEKWNLTNG